MVQKYIVGDAYKQNLFRGIKTIIFNSLILIKLFIIITWIFIIAIINIQFIFIKIK